jgi:uncharacterized protein (TIGR02145 family)
MKTKIALLFITAFICSLSACDDSEEPKTLATVTTITPTSVTINSATVGGNISSNGGDAITSSGVVYSSNVAVPTTADNKLEITAANGPFSGSLTGLASGTMYHTRAYATNGQGTSYGEVIDFTTGNQAPVVTNVIIDGTLEVNKTVTAKYSYNDAENNAEGVSIFKWYMASSAAGTDEAVVSGATTKDLLITEAMNGKYLKVAVTPKASVGTADGLEVKSMYVGKVGEATTVTFTYDGATVTYGIITSAKTERKWMDRNLGATRAATSKEDFLAIGHYFQWGRPADGHQRVTRSGLNDGDAVGVTGTTSSTSPYETSPIDVPATDKFIIDNSIAGDWLNPQAVVPSESNLWQGTTGKNNPCPTGWKIPTPEEWAAEELTSVTNGFSKLKLTYTGFRAFSTGAFGFSTSYAGFWTSGTKIGRSGQQLTYIADMDDSYYGSDTNRGNGYPCRCIKE